VTKFLLATFDATWAARVRDAFAGSLNGDLRTLEPASYADPSELMREVDRVDPAVLVVGPDVDDTSALALAQAVDESRPDMSVVLVANSSPTLLTRAVRAGVRDIIDPGTTDEELRASLERAMETTLRRRNVIRTNVESQAPASHVITVVSPKGGAGKTAITSNLAVGLARFAPHEVVLVDLDLQFGDVANALRLTPERTIADVARSGAEIDATTVKAFLTPHPGDLFVLCAPESPAEADMVKPELVGRVIDLLAEMFRYVVVDTSAGLDETTLAAMEHSSDIVVVCATDVSSARGLRKELEAFDLLGLTSQRRHFALNRADARVGLAAHDIVSTVGMEITVEIPSSRIVPTSMNQGSPVLESDPRSGVGKALTQLVGRFVPANLVSVPEPAGPAVGAGLFRRRKDPR
jgi:pilus assembly protein CpaE